MKFTPLEEIDSILNSLVKFSNTNEYDFRLFDKYAEEQAKVFNMYFSKIENEDDKQKILSQLDDNFHFLIDDVVTDMLASSCDNGSIIESNIEVAVVPNVTTPDYRVSGFKENYRELIRLFKSKIKTSEPEQSEKGKKDKKPTKKNTCLFEIGLKLALGELDEYLTFDKDGKRIDHKLSYPEIAKIFNLDQQYLKCTLSSYIGETNKSKKLHNNPEIIEKVLIHLKSEGKEPKEWFLKEFKK